MINSPGKFSIIGSTNCEMPFEHIIFQGHSMVSTGRMFLQLLHIGEDAFNRRVLMVHSSKSYGRIF